jgi:hypothetical protein
MRKYKYTLESDKVFSFPELKGINGDYPFGPIRDGIIIIYKGYAWDGCTAVPDYPSTFNAGLIHDFLYQYRAVPRKTADRLFYKQLKIDKFKASGLYYAGVRVFGCLFYYKK